MTDRSRKNEGFAEDLLADDDSKSPASLMRTLEEDVRQVRVGNGAPESVPVFQSRDDPNVRFVRFADLSTNVRRILDICPEVDVHVDGRRKSGARNWREIGGWRSPVLEWQDQKQRI